MVPKQKRSCFWWNQHVIICLMLVSFVVNGFCSSYLRVASACWFVSHVCLYLFLQKKKHARKNISSVVRMEVWIQEFGEAFSGTCPCCQRFQLTSFNFEVGHKKAVAHGGSNSLDNLIPLCSKCNRSMNTQSLHDFKTLVQRK